MSREKNSLKQNKKLHWRTFIRKLLGIKKTKDLSVQQKSNILKVFEQIHNLNLFKLSAPDSNTPEPFEKTNAFYYQKNNIIDAVLNIVYNPAFDKYVTVYVFIKINGVEHKTAVNLSQESLRFFLIPNRENGRTDKIKKDHLNKIIMDVLNTHISKMLMDTINNEHNQSSINKILFNN